MLNYQSATEIMSQVLTKSTGRFKTALTEKIRHYPGIQYIYIYNISDVMRVRIYIYIHIGIPLLFYGLFLDYQHSTNSTKASTERPARGIGVESTFCRIHYWIGACIPNRTATFLCGIPKNSDSTVVYG